MATQPPSEMPEPTQPGQPIQPPPEIVQPGPDIDQPAPGTMPDTAPGQPV